MSMPTSCQILATSETEAQYMSQRAEAQGSRVTGATVWRGVIPPNSYVEIDEHTRMSTAEFFFLRKANELPFEEAVSLGNELCGLYATARTVHDFPFWYWESIPEQRTSVEKILEYLLQVPGAVECQVALKVLAYVEDGRTMP